MNRKSTARCVVKGLILLPAVFFGNLAFSAQADNTEAEMRKEYRIDLRPGEGTILLIGKDRELADVKAKYFSADSPAPEGVLDRMMFGFWGGADRLQRSGPEYVDRMMKVYKELGSTFVFGYNGNMKGGEDSNASRYAALGAKHGMKVIITPTDQFFRDQRYWDREELGGYARFGRASAEEYLEKHLMPRLKQSAPGVRDDENIWAWQPVEEIPPEAEALYTEYKKAFKELLPKHLLFQLDSQQADYERLKHKERPYPDIAAFNRYLWWDRNEGLWTPDYAAGSLFGQMKQYASAAHKHMGEVPAVFVAQGTAGMHTVSKEDGIARGWEAREGFRPSKRTSVSWRPSIGKFVRWDMYLAPTNAWRLQNWLAVCAGYKGLMFWSGGPVGLVHGTDIESVLGDVGENTDDGGHARVGLIDEDLNVHPHAKEVAQSWNEIRSFEKLILQLHPAEIERKVSVKGGRVYTNTFRDKAGNEFIIVVNGDIVRYDGNNPVWLDWPNTKLAVGDAGELINYTPLTEKRTVEIELPADVNVYDLRSLTEN